MMPDPITIAGIVGAGLAGWFGGKKGGRSGAEGTLNGTAEAVRGLVTTVGLLERTLGKVDTKLDKHIEETTYRLTGLAEDASDARERVARIEGQLTVAAGSERRRTPRP